MNAMTGAAVTLILGRRALLPQRLSSWRDAGCPVWAFDHILNPGQRQCLRQIEFGVVGKSGKRVRDTVLLFANGKLPGKHSAQPLRRSVGHRNYTSVRSRRNAQDQAGAGLWAWLVSRSFWKPTPDNVSGFGGRPHNHGHP